MKSPSRRPDPIWLTYLARIVALAIFVGGPFAARSYGYGIDGKEEWGIAFALSGGAALIVGSLTMHLLEWLVNAHRDSVETKARYNFGIMLLTAGLVVVGVATLVNQWHNNAG